MIEDGHHQFLRGTRFPGGRRAKRTEARALWVELSERSRLRKTATKPAEFSGLNRSTQSYGIITLFKFIYYNNYKVNNDFLYNNKTLKLK